MDLCLPLPLKFLDPALSQVSSEADGPLVAGTGHVTPSQEGGMEVESKFMLSIVSMTLPGVVQWIEC